MVGWYDPAQLVRTGVRTLLATIFGAYADKRELQAALQQPESYRYTNDEEIWIDYVADLGDGWDSTYTIAWLLAQSALTLDAEGRVTIPRGRLLIMGGDQVYPVAKRKEYRDRMVGPYRAALPCVPGDRYPHLFAIPGNHDWYDGLTSFTRLFCQKRWIGGWRTQQSRSYFAIQLPHRWWLWGVDIQLEADIDKPQRDYFETIARQEMQPGDRIILATAKPSWVLAGTGQGTAREERHELDPSHNLTFLEEKLIRKHGGVLTVVLAGDLHHYSHYRETHGRCHRITAGGGGAFLHGTHSLPETLTLEEGGRPSHYGRTATFPSPRRSRWLPLANLLFPLRNWKFSLFLGGFYFLYAWLLQNASRHSSPTFLERIRDLPATQVFDMLAAFAAVLANSPTAVGFLLALIGGLILFCEPPPARLPWLQTATRTTVGTLHAVLHLLLNLALMRGFAWLNFSVLGFGSSDGRHLPLLVAELVLAGGLGGGLLFGLYLFLTNVLLGFHRETAFSALRIADYKNFLRLHISRTGLTLFPVGIRKVARRWRLRPQAATGEAWFTPVDRRIEAHGIEAPIVISTPTDERARDRHGSVV